MLKKIHLGIIPDGNRRWAKRQLLKPWQGHERAMENSRALFDWCRQNPQIGYLTLWGFSTDNWNRSGPEVDHLMRIFEDYLKRERTTFVDKKAKFVHSGRLDRIPSTLAELIQDVEADTVKFDDFVMNLAIDYGGQDEVLRAINKLPERGEVTASDLHNYFDHPELPDLDLIIRTSGEQRGSGFFIWQAAYAEWYFETKYFPELKPADLEKAMAEYNRRQRRYGR